MFPLRLSPVSFVNTLLRSGQLGNFVLWGDRMFECHVTVTSGGLDRMWPCG
eukprot:m.269430 g.269430  ORF g.269430 m.269430 type:complete len:51 (+) comp40536_c0_seq2:84-236(+)